MTEAGTLARARAFADRVATHIRGGCHQLGACAKAGLPWRTHMRWMAADAAEGSDLAYYQSQVLDALEDQRQASLKAGAKAVEDADPSKANAAFNVWKLGHDGRFKRFETHDSEATKVELTGAEGGPLAVAAVPASREQALDMLRAQAARDPLLAAELKKLTGG